MHQDRKTFLKTMGCLLGTSLARSFRGMGVSIPTPRFSDASELAVLKALPPAADEEEVITAVRNAAEGTTDFSWLSRGDTVLIKPAANSPRRFPATTSPVAIRAMVGLLKDRGAGKVILADKPGVQYVYQGKSRQRGSSRKVMMTNGLHQAALSAGGEVHDFDESGYDAYFGDRTVHESH